MIMDLVNNRKNFNLKIQVKNSHNLVIIAQDFFFYEEICN